MMDLSSKVSTDNEWKSYWEGEGHYHDCSWNIYKAYKIADLIAEKLLLLKIKGENTSG